MAIREELIEQITKEFINDLLISLKPFDKAEEAADFCGILKELAIELYRDDGLQFDEDEFLLEKLYSRFKSKLTPFIKSNLLLYLKKDHYHETLLFQKLKITDTPGLDVLEWQELFANYYNLFTEVQKRLYLKETVELGNLKVEQNLVEEAKELIAPKIAGFNRSRQTLIFYFLLKGYNIDRNSTSLAGIARFIHTALGLPYNDINNSEFYKRLKTAPLFKNDHSILQDLEYVKQQFEMIGCHQVAALVEAEIQSIRKTKH